MPSSAFRSIVPKSQKLDALEAVEIRQAIERKLVGLRGEAMRPAARCSRRIHSSALRGICGSPVLKSVSSRVRFGVMDFLGCDLNPKPIDQAVDSAFFVSQRGAILCQRLEVIVRIGCGYFGTTGSTRYRPAEYLPVGVRPARNSPYRHGPKGRRRRRRYAAS